MSQKLYLLRHAEADPWSPMGNDFSRSLTSGGIQHAKLLANWAMDNLAIPDTILCSPAKRTRQTLAPILSHWHQALSTTDYVEPMYGATTNLLLTLAEDAFSYSECLLMIGHNPGIENLLRKVGRDRRSSGHGHSLPGTLTVIDFPGGFKRDSQIGRLIHLVTRKDLSDD